MNEQWLIVRWDENKEITEVIGPFVSHRDAIVYAETEYGAPDPLMMDGK